MGYFLSQQPPGIDNPPEFGRHGYGEDQNTLPFCHRMLNG